MEDDKLVQLAINTIRTLSIDAVRTDHPAKTTRITMARPASTKLRRASQRCERVLGEPGPGVMVNIVL